MPYRDQYPSDYRIRNRILIRNRKHMISARAKARDLQHRH
jgi:hypothetical protein